MSATCKLWARVGNQMFMISATIGYAVKHKINYFIPSHTISPHVWPTYFPQFPKGIVQPHFFRYKEPDHSYNEIPFYENIELEGYFQSEKYFEHCRPYIISAFQIPYQKLHGFVSIHVRRGDYVQYADKHPPVTIEYLTDAINHFIDLGYKSFFVCSDDIAWCRENLMPMEHKAIVFSYSRGHGPIEDLAMMSCCEHNIISNSSFSWWASYLNQNPDKVVIAPKIWFGPGNAHLSTKDLIPEGWIII